MVTHDHDDYSFAPAIPTPHALSVTHYSKRQSPNTDTSTLYRSRYSAEESSEAAHQADLQFRVVQLRKRQAVIISLVVLSFFMGIVVIKFNRFLVGINAPFAMRMASTHDGVVRNIRDDEFFYNITAQDWEQRLQQTKQLLSEQDALNADASTDMNPKSYWKDNWKINFRCDNEIQIHNKFLCDPFRLVSLAVEYLNSQRQGYLAGRECIVYLSSGETEDDVQFANQFLDYTLKRVEEIGMTTSVCDVHIFNPNFKVEPQQRDNLFIHKWGFKPKQAINSNSTDTTFKTIEETIQELGQSNKMISILALDCEGCEWDIYNDLLSLTSPIRQLLIQVHGVTDRTVPMFNALRQGGYAITNRMQALHGDGEVINYSFLKLPLAYFDG